MHSTKGRATRLMYEPQLRIRNQTLTGSEMVTNRTTTGSQSTNLDTHNYAYKPDPKQNRQNRQVPIRYQIAQSMQHNWRPEKATTISFAQSELPRESGANYQERKAIGRQELRLARRHIDAVFAIHKLHNRIVRRISHCCRCCLQTVTIIKICKMTTRNEPVPS